MRLPLGSNSNKGSVTRATKSWLSIIATESSNSLLNNQPLRLQLSLQIIKPLDPILVLRHQDVLRSCFDKARLALGNSSNANMAMKRLNLTTVTIVYPIVFSVLELVHFAVVWAAAAGVDPVAPFAVAKVGSVDCVSGHCAY